jgi:hypothetical protein
MSRMPGYLGEGNSELRMSRETVDELGTEYELRTLNGLLESMGLVDGPKIRDQVYENVGTAGCKRLL